MISLKQLNSSHGRKLTKLAILRLNLDCKKIFRITFLLGISNKHNNASKVDEFAFQNKKNIVESETINV